jgi:(E)-2-((N-methylformamido)methylene)succinate hydrolase
MPEGESWSWPRRKKGPIAYVEEGQGEVLLLIHGVGLNANAWSPQIAAFSRTHRVLAIDMPGHGASDRLEEPATLDAYMRVIADFLAARNITKANIAGHSMGGLLAIGLALARPHACLRLAALNTVYKRSAEKRAAVIARARRMAMDQTANDIEGPLERWFDSSPGHQTIAALVRRWLIHADPAGYAAAYDVFARNDEAFAGHLQALAMPALFATGSEDPNSTPEMSQAMARETPQGRALVLPAARHMMNLTDPDAVNAALLAFLADPVATPSPEMIR